MRKHLRLSIGLAALVAVGCGGGGSYHFTPPQIGGSTTLTEPGKSTPTTTTTAPTTSAVTTSLNVTSAEGVTTTETVAVPAGITITPADTVAVIPATFPIGITPIAGSNSASGVKPRVSTVTPGEVYLVDPTTGNLSDLHLSIQGININGTLGASFIALPANNQKLLLFVSGTFNLGSGTNILTVNNGLYLKYSHFGPFSWPTKVAYTLPANGGNLTSANIQVGFVANELADVDGSGFANVQYGSVSKTYTAPVVVNSQGQQTLTILDPATDPQDPIPASGVDVVSLAVGATGSF